MSQNANENDGRPTGRTLLGRALLATVAASILSWTPLHGQLPQGKPPLVDDSNFDARIEANQGRHAQAPPSQAAGIQALAGPTGRLAVTFDDLFGTTRTLTNPQGYLTPPAQGKNPLDIALEYVRANVRVLGLESADL